MTPQCLPSSLPSLGCAHNQGSFSPLDGGYLTSSLFGVVPLLNRTLLCPAPAVMNASYKNSWVKLRSSTWLRFLYITSREINENQGKELRCTENISFSMGEMTQQKELLMVSNPFLNKDTRPLSYFILFHTFPPRAKARGPDSRTPGSYELSPWNGELTHFFGDLKYDYMKTDMGGLRNLT